MSNPQVGDDAYCSKRLPSMATTPEGATSPNRRGSSNRTLNYNPPVSSCTDRKIANYRQLRLILKIRLLRQFQERSWHL